MSYKILFLFCFLFTLGAIAQQRDSLKLIQTLQHISQEDQIYRRLLFIEPYFQSKKDSLIQHYNLDESLVKQELRKAALKADQNNLQQIKQIIEELGYPGKSLVGPEYASVAWLVLHHSEELEAYLDILQQAALNKQIPFSNYAYSLDRVLMRHNKPQIYGSQAKEFVLKDGSKHFNIWPIEDAKNVNKRRKSAKIPYSIKAYAKQMGIKYKIYTISDIAI